MGSSRVARLSLALLLAAAASARADIVELKNGGKIHGDVTNASDKSAATYEIVTSTGGRLSLARGEVARIVSQSPLQDEYHRRRAAAADTADAHWKLAEWCRSQRLVSEYRAEVAKVLELDPAHEKAHLAAGHQKGPDGWKSRDDVMTARGMIWYDGKYYTQHHIELLEQTKTAKQTDADWNGKLDRWRRWLTGRRQDRSEEALHEIQALTDPAAAPAVLALLAEENDPAVRRLLLDTAARLDTPQVLDVLVKISLADDDEELRFAALEHLIATGRPGIAGPYVQALRSSDNALVNRAAEALGMIGDRDTIGPLINALVTKHKYKEGGGSSNQHAYTFTPTGGMATSFGSAPAKIVTQDVENAAALAALTKLSGVNFGFDQARWREWLLADAKAHPVDLRRDQ